MHTGVTGKTKRKCGEAVIYWGPSVVTVLAVRTGNIEGWTACGPAPPQWVTAVWRWCHFVLVFSFSFHAKPSSQGFNQRVDDGWKITLCVYTCKPVRLFKEKSVCEKRTQFCIREKICLLPHLITSSLFLLSSLSNEICAKCGKSLT